MTDLKKIKNGEILSSTMYLTVKGVKGETVSVVDSQGMEFDINGKDIIESLVSSSQYNKTEKVTRTAMAEILTSVGDSVFTCTFTKQDGSKRTLTGRLTNTENLLGRSNAIDLTITSGHNVRQIDHRTLEELIYKGTRYTLK